jgi:hypothetical protein
MRHPLLFRGGVWGNPVRDPVAMDVYAFGEE